MGRPEVKLRASPPMVHIPPSGTPRNATSGGRLAARRRPPPRRSGRSERSRPQLPSYPLPVPSLVTTPTMYRTSGLSPHRAAALTRLRVQHGSGRMSGADSRWSEQRICRDANEQEERDHDRRNQVSHGFPCKVNRIGGGRVGVRSQHRVEYRHPKGKAGEHHHSSVKIFLLRRTSLLSTRRGRLLACW